MCLKKWAFLFFLEKLQDLENFFEHTFSKEVNLREHFSSGEAIGLVNREALEMKVRLNRKTKWGIGEL